MFCLTEIKSAQLVYNLKENTSFKLSLNNYVFYSKTIYAWSKLKSYKLRETMKPKQTFK